VYLNYYQVNLKYSQFYFFPTALQFSPSLQVIAQICKLSPQICKPSSKSANYLSPSMFQKFAFVPTTCNCKIALPNYEEFPEKINRYRNVWNASYR
jgi:hypothetical protein